jgi:hypothetical protein
VPRRSCLAEGRSPRSRPRWRGRWRSPNRGVPRDNGAGTVAACRDRRWCRRGRRTSRGSGWSSRRARASVPGGIARDIEPGRRGRRRGSAWPPMAGSEPASFEACLEQRPGHDTGTSSAVVAVQLEWICVAQRRAVARLHGQRAGPAVRVEVSPEPHLFAGGLRRMFDASELCDDKLVVAPRQPRGLAGCGRALANQGSPWRVSLRSISGVR